MSRGSKDPAAVARAMRRAAEALEKISLKYVATRRGNDDDWTRAISALTQGAAWHSAMAASSLSSALSDVRESS